LFALQLLVPLMMARRDNGFPRLNAFSSG